VSFKKDSVFLVFAYTDGENSRTFWTNDCSNSGLLSENHENYKKPGIPVTHKSSSEWADDFMKQNSLKKIQSKIQFQLFKKLMRK